MTCPACGTPTQETDRHCTSCGAVLGGTLRPEAKLVLQSLREQLKGMRESLQTVAFRPPADLYRGPQAFEPVAADPSSHGESVDSLDYRVVVTRGKRAGEVFEVGRIITFGRAANCEVQLTDIAISREHCRIVFHPERRVFLLQDLGSHNGSYLNDQRVARGELSSGDRIRVGEATLVFFRGALPADIRRDLDARGIQVSEAVASLPGAAEEAASEAHPPTMEVSVDELEEIGRAPTMDGLPALEALDDASDGGLPNLDASDGGFGGLESLLQAPSGAAAAAQPGDAPSPEPSPAAAVERPEPSPVSPPSAAAPLDPAPQPAAAPSAPPAEPRAEPVAPPAAAAPADPAAEDEEEDEDDFAIGFAETSVAQAAMLDPAEDLATVPLDRSQFQPRSTGAAAAEEDLLLASSSDDSEPGAAGSKSGTPFPGDLGEAEGFVAPDLFALAPGEAPPAATPRGGSLPRGAAATPAPEAQPKARTPVRHFGVGPRPATPAEGTVAPARRPLGAGGQGGAGMQRQQAAADSDTAPVTEARGGSLFPWIVIGLFVLLLAALAGYLLSR